MVTGITEVTQDPEKAGSALKILSLRLRGMKGQLEELGEPIDENVENISKMQGQILNMTGGKVNIFDASGDFKSTYEIMKGIAEVWDDLSSIDQANLLETIAGKNRANDVAALLSNWQNVEAAVISATNAEGSAARENAKYIDSVQGRLDRLTTAWQTFANTFMNSDFLKSGISLLTEVVEIIEFLVDKLGTLGTIGVGVGAFNFFDQLLAATKHSGGLKSLTNIANILPTLTKMFPNAAKGIQVFTHSLKTTQYIDVFANALGYSSAGAGLAKAATVTKGALSGLWTVMAAHPILTTIAAVSAAIAIYDKFTESAKELAEKVEEVTTEYKTQSESLRKLKGDYDTSNESSMISKYGKLSKGVNALGENVSLTADEYAEYQSIVETIAGQIPSLVTGYNSQGDAILSCAGSVDKLSQAYKDLVVEQNKALLDTGEDVFKDFKNDLSKDKSKYGLSNNNIKELEKLMNMSDTELEAYISKMGTDPAMDISDILEKYGIKRNVLGDNEKGWETSKEHIISSIKESRAEIKNILDEASTDLNAYAEELGLVTEAYFSTAFIGGDGSDIGDYSHMSEKMQNIITQVTSGFDSDFYDDFLSKENPYEALTEYYDSMLEAFDGLGNAGQTRLEAAFDLQTQFNGGDISYGEYVDSLKDAGELIDGLNLDEEVKTSIKLSLGLNEDGLVEEYETLSKRIVNMSTKHIRDLGHFSGASDAMKMAAEDAKEFLDSLSAEELSVATDIIPKLDANATLKEIQAAINREMAVRGLTFDLNLEVETVGIEALNTAMAESVSATGLSSESINALKGRYADLEAEGYNLSAMFEETSNGIHLNRQAAAELEQAYANQKLKDVDSDLKGLKKEYDLLTEEINNCTDAGERASLYVQRDAILQQINDAATLAAQYEGLTSAYNEWQNAESAGQERDMYENVISGLENIDDEISRGWYDDGTIEFLELLTGKELSTAPIKDLKKAYKGLKKEINGAGYSVRDFFTVDDEGNSTNTGVYNFLETVEAEFDNVIKKENGKIKSFDFSVVAEKDENGNVIKNGDQVIAEALGISEELVQIMLRAADDAGFVVNLEGAYTQLADLKTEAETARDKLIDLKKNGLEKLNDVDVNFDLEAQGNDLVKEHEKAIKLLDKFKKDGKVDLSMEGAQQALDIAEYLTIKLDDLTEPRFMQIEVSEVDEDLRDPIEKIQEIGNLCKEKHLVQLTGDTKEIEKTQAEIDKIAKEIEELDPEVKAQVGIDEDWTAEEIADAIETGELEIPAELELDVQMSDDLKDMRLMMMNQLGLVSDNEVKLKIGYEVDDSVVNELADEEKEVVIKYIEENEDAWDKLSDEEKEILVELVASGVDLETLTDEEKKQVLVEFVTENEEEFDKLTDEEKEVVVDLAVDDDALKSLEEHGVEIEAFCNIFGVEKVDDLKAKLDGLDDEQILVLAEVLGRIDVEKLKTTVESLDDKTIEAIAKALGEGDVEGLKTTINGLDDKTVQAIAEALGYSSVKELNGAIDNLNPKTVQAIAEALGITDVDSLKAAIDRLTNKDVKAVATVDGKDDVNSLKSAIDNLKGKTVTVWASIKKKASNLWDKLTGDGEVDGTAHVSGTAFANGTTGRAFKQGDWGAKDSGVALGGEEAPELLVRNGRWHLIGEKGAEFFGYKKGDIIFNASQTKEIFEKGKITHGNGRGRALVSGTAFAGGSSGSGGAGKVGGNSVTGQSYGKSSSSSSSDKDFEEVIDWIEVIIDRVERAIDKFDQQANNIYKSWSSRNKALINETSKVKEEIALQQKAYNKYIEAANGVGLSSSWATKVRNGEIDIETIKDEALKEKIDDYQKWYEAALDAEKAIEELKEKEAELYAQRVENVSKQYEGILGVIEHEKNIIEEYISQNEANAQLVSGEYYKALASNERETITQLEKEKAAMLKELQTAMTAEDNPITKGSEAWYDMVAQIDDVTLAIAQSQTKLKEYDQTLQQISWESFDLLQEKISAVAEESEFLIELLSDDKLYDDNGQLTDSGMATMGLHGQNYNTNMYQADMYGAEAERLKKELAKDPFDTDLEKRYRDMVSLQQEHILAAEGEKEAIRDMVEEGINLELDALQERIDKYNESIESAKDLYDYQERVKEQTSEIASLQKQLGAYAGDDSEEAKAKVQELKVSLADAESELQETEYDKWISDQTALLDELYLEYETILNTRLDNIDALLSDMIVEINTNASSISTTLSEKADSVGYELSNSMTSIWDTNSTKINNVITNYGDKFTSAQTTTNNALKTINTNLQTMVAQLNKVAKTNVKSASLSSAANSKEANAKKKEEVKKPTTTTTTTSTSNKKIEVGGKINAGSAKIYDYAGDKSGERQLYRKDPVYKVLKTSGNWLQVRWHKLSKGITGWFKKGDVKAYASGTKKIISDDMAWTQEKGQEFIVRPSDGAILTPVAKGDSVLNANASNNIWDMANSPAEFIKDNLNLGVTNVPNNSNTQNTYTQHLDKVVFNLPNVKNYEQLLSEMQKDKSFEKLILSMTIDQIAGKSSLAKNKSIR